MGAGSREITESGREYHCRLSVGTTVAPTGSLQSWPFSQLCKLSWSPCTSVSLNRFTVASLPSPILPRLRMKLCPLRQQHILPSLLTLPASQSPPSSRHVPLCDHPLICRDHNRGLQPGQPYLTDPSSPWWSTASLKSVLHTTLSFKPPVAPIT